MEQTDLVCNTTCGDQQFQWRACGKNGEWENFTSCDNFGDNEALEARCRKDVSVGSHAKTKMKLKTHLFKVDFRNMSLRVVNRNGLGVRLRLCKDLALWSVLPFQLFAAEIAAAESSSGAFPIHAVLIVAYCSYSVAIIAEECLKPSLGRSGLYCSFAE